MIAEFKHPVLAGVPHRSFATALFADMVPSDDGIDVKNEQRMLADEMSK